MHVPVLIAAVLVIGSLAGCAGEQTRNCEATERYSAATSSPPVQIPDDLSPPNESEALRLPPDVTANRSQPSQPCLESPPSFFGAGRPGPTGRPAAAAEAPAPAEAPASAEEPAASEADAERAIDN